MRIKDWGKGWNADQPPWELAPGYWSTIQNARFRNGKAERMGGIALATTPSVAPYALGLFQVGAATGTTRYTVEIGLAKVYVWDGTTRTEITRGLHGRTNGFAGSGTEVTVTTDANHGLTTGDNVIVRNVVPTSYNTGSSGASITVLSATTFKYNNTSVAAVTSDGFWSSNRTSDFTASAGQEFSVFALNGFLYINSILDGLYYWGGSTSSGAQGRLRRIDVGDTGRNWVYARTARFYKDYVMVLGFISNSSSLTSTAANKSPFTLGWSSAAEPGSIPSTFSSATTNDAGSIQKTRGIWVDGLEYSGTFYAYTERGILAVEYIGGNDVFNTSRWVSDSTGLLAPNCVVNCDAGQVFLSQNLDVMIHQGGQPRSIADGRVWGWIKSNIDTTNYARAFLAVNRKFNEVWVCIPTTGNTTPDKALVWNWEDDTWGYRDLPTGTTCATSGMLPTSVATDDRMLFGTTAPKVGLVDSGTTDFGSAYTTTLERIGMDFDDPSYKMLSRTMPLFDGSTNFTASIYHGAASTQDGSPTYASAATYTHNTTTWVNAFSTSGKYLAWKMTTTASDTPALRSIDFDISKQGGF